MSALASSELFGNIINFFKKQRASRFGGLALFRNDDFIRKLAVSFFVFLSMFGNAFELFVKFGKQFFIAFILFRKLGKPVYYAGINFAAFSGLFRNVVDFIRKRG